MRRIGLVIIASHLPGGAHVVPALAAPCALVCFPPAVLDVKKCACEQAISRKPVCSLVCLDPDQTLDAQKCVCVRRPR
jgi:hypothetical protein